MAPSLNLDYDYVVTKILSVMMLKEYSMNGVLTMLRYLGQEFLVGA